MQTYTMEQQKCQGHFLNSFKIAFSSARFMRLSATCNGINARFGKNKTKNTEALTASARSDFIWLNLSSSSMPCNLAYFQAEFKKLLGQKNLPGKEASQSLDVLIQTGSSIHKARVALRQVQLQRAQVVDLFLCLTA